MAINNINGSGNTHSLISESLRQNNAQSTQGHANNAAAANPVNNTGDTISLTSTAAQLRALEQQLTSQPVVDVERVNKVRNELNSGSFDFNPDRVAQKMIGLEQLINEKLHS